MEQILALYMKNEDNGGDYMIFFDHISVGKLKNRLNAVGLACGIQQPLIWHLTGYCRLSLPLKINSLQEFTS